MALKEMQELLELNESLRVQVLTVNKENNMLREANNSLLDKIAKLLSENIQLKAVHRDCPPKTIDPFKET